MAKKITLLFLIIINPFVLSLFINNQALQLPVNSFYYNIGENKPNLSTKTVRLISNNPYEDFDPAVAIDSSNVIHLVWVSYNYGDSKNHIMYTNSTDFTNIIRISNVSTYDYNPCITVDFSDIVHIAWEGSEKIYYTNSSVNYSNYSLVSQQTYVDDPQIACDSSGGVHIVWEGYQAGNWDIFYANSTTNFANKQISPNIFDDEEPDLCIYNGIIHIVWEKEIDDYDDVIAYTNSTDFYSSEKIISQNGDSYCPKIAADNNGYVHIVWNGRADSYFDSDQLIIIFLIYIVLPYFNDYPFVPPWYRYQTSPIFPSTYFYDFDYSVYYSNSINKFQTQIEISKPIETNSYWPDILVDTNNICHIIWYGYLPTSFSHSYLFYTNSTENFQTFKCYSFDSYNKYPKIANDTSNTIHCVFETYYNNYDVYLSNVTDFQIYSNFFNVNWEIINLYSIIPKMPDMSIISMVVLLFLVGFNVVAFLIYSHQREEKPSGKVEKKKEDGSSKKKRGNKIIVEKNGKKVKVRLP